MIKLFAENRTDWPALFWLRAGHRNFWYPVGPTFIFILSRSKTLLNPLKGEEFANGLNG
jgi:hypothetical protein